jgi:hypothetical protein
MDKDTPLNKRLYYRCYDCLATTCIESDDKRRKVYCGICGGQLEFLGQVEGTHWTHTKEVCDCNEACQGATGPKCTCRCGAVNHGVGFRYHEEVDATGKVTITPETNKEKHAAIASEFRSAYTAAREKMITRLGDNWRKYCNHIYLDRSTWDCCRTAEYQFGQIRKAKMHKTRMSKIAKFDAWLDKWAGQTA